MKLKKDKIDEYIDIHKKGNVWPEVIKNITDSGVKKMKIYVLDEYSIVYAEAEDIDGALKKMGDREIQHKWNEATADFMDTQPDYDSEEVVKKLKCVFDLENGKQK